MARTVREELMAERHLHGSLDVVKPLKTPESTLQTKNLLCICQVELAAYFKFLYDCNGPYCHIGNLKGPLYHVTNLNVPTDTWLAPEACPFHASCLAHSVHHAWHVRHGIMMMLQAVGQPLSHLICSRSIWIPSSVVSYCDSLQRKRITIR